MATTSDAIVKQMMQSLEEKQLLKYCEKIYPVMFEWLYDDLVPGETIIAIIDQYITHPAWHHDKMLKDVRAGRGHRPKNCPVCGKVR